MQTGLTRFVVQPSRDFDQEHPVEVVVLLPNGQRAAVKISTAEAKALAHHLTTTSTCAVVERMRDRQRAQPMLRNAI